MRRSSWIKLTYLVLIALSLGLMFFKAKVLPPRRGNVALQLDDRPGNLLRFMVRLKQQGGRVHPVWFARLGRWLLLPHPRPGVYYVTGQDTYFTLWRKLFKNRAEYQVLRINEGLTFKQLRELVAKEPHLTHFITASDSDDQVMAKLGLTNLAPEGRFAPDTYYFVKGSTDVALLLSAYRRMENWLEAEWQQRSTKCYQCAYKALIVASLIEKEVRAPHELNLVAGVILSRLTKGMRLQIDASTIYGLGKRYRGRLTRRQLNESDSAYNTYRYYGLPPTPICLPGRRAIRAALHPEFKYLYYVVKPDGTHAFSSSLVEHNEAVAKYRPGKP